MRVEASQHVELPVLAAQQDVALAFVRSPQRGLAQVHFLSSLLVSGPNVRGEIAVQLPLLGEVRLPFLSVLELTATGAQLRPQVLSSERAWIEVAGSGDVTPTALHYDFTFCAHLDVPSAEQWGGQAFEKMVRAAAARTLARVAQDLPSALANAWATEAAKTSP